MVTKTFQTDTALEALIVEQALLFARNLQSEGEAAPHGKVLARLESVVLQQGREFQRLALQAALQTRADDVDRPDPVKKGNQ